MCGILGIVAPPGRTVRLTRRDALRMRDTMAARGPDGAGVLEWRNVVLAHRRLAIRDPEGGAQPWVSDDGQAALVYNGELYNDAELRQTLSARGHRFVTQCDTETLMAAWQEWGADCVSRLEGMFAFGVYDFTRQTLFLARDRCGVKPLFLTEIDGDLIFASSLPAILAHPRFQACPNWPVLSHYLTTFRLTLGRETVYQRIVQLLPGERLQSVEGRIALDSYWNPPEDCEPAIDYASAAQRVEAALREAVSSQLVADVPVGMFLSGGVDSSTLACLVRDAGQSHLVGQCGGGTGGAPDFEFARRCADHVDFSYGEVRVDPEQYWERWQQLVADYQTPVSTPSDVVISRLAEEMKKSVGVVLGGEGADEALCGYSVPHWAGHDCDLSRRLGSGAWPGSSRAAAVFRSTLRKHYGRDRFDSETDHYFALNSLIPTAVKPALFQPRIWREAEEDRRMWDRYRIDLEGEPDKPLPWRHRRLLHRVNLESLLARLDTATMHSGLEARVPYTDTRFLDAALRLPMEHCIDVDPEEQSPYQAAGELEQRGSLRTKRVLRTIAERIMPGELAHRKKASFPTPVARWLGHEWQPRVEQLLLNSPFAREHLRTEAVAELTANPAAAGMWLWPVLNLCAWGDQAFAA